MLAVVEIWDIDARLSPIGHSHVYVNFPMIRIYNYFSVSFFEAIRYPKTDECREATTVKNWYFNCYRRFGV